jgi:hypothetical protein
LEDSVRFPEYGVILDQYNAGQLAGTAQAVLDYRLTDGRLLRGEAKNAGWIAPDHESNPAVAQIADSVEQDESRLRPHDCTSIFHVKVDRGLGKEEYSQ